jgi:50S ribosomal protein L16 3-hydroxylase
VTLHVVDGPLDWAELTERFWDRGPVLFRGIDPAPFVADEVFAAAVAACRTDEPSVLPPDTQFTVERWQRTDPAGALPRAADGTFDVYQDRMAAELDGRRYALVIHRFHAHHFPQWIRERAFYSGLWDRVGLPLSGAITTLFHGSYEHSPVGVHRDRFATFMFGLKGRKRMRFWDERPWTEPVSSVLDYERHLDTSFTAEVGPGDLLYWPANYYHVGESATGQPATSVNIGVPRADHHASYDLDDVLGGADDGTPSGAMFAPDGDLPRVWEDCLANLRDHLREDRAGELSLSHRTAGGFRPVPPSAKPAPLDDDRELRAAAEILTTGRLCAANGHVVHTGLRAPADALRPLLDGRAVRVRDLLAGTEQPDELRAALAALVAIRGLTT